MPCIKCLFQTGIGSCGIFWVPCIKCLFQTGIGSCGTPPHDGTPLSGPSKCRFQKNLEKTHSPPKLFRPKNSPGPKSAGQKIFSFWKKFERCSAKIHVLCRSDNVRGMRKILVPVRNYVDRGSASRIYRFNKEKSLSFICSSNVVCMIVPKRRATSKPKLAILVPRSQGNAASSALG